MIVVVAKHAGFCYGVRRALECTYQVLDCTPVYTYGPLIHNEQVVDDLREKGVRVLQYPEPIPGGTIIIRSHGAPPEDIERLRSGGMRVVDATCSYVARIHQKVAHCRAEGIQVFIVGEPKHPETIGTLGWAGKGAVALSCLADVDALGQYDRACVVAQTTMQRDQFKALVERLKEHVRELDVLDSICSATTERQQEAVRLAKQSDAMIVVGGRHSANTQNLAALCRVHCANVFCIETAGELQRYALGGFDHIGITAGASTPVESIEEVVNYMNELDKALETTVIENTQQGTEPIVPAAEVPASEPEKAPEDNFMSEVEKTMVSIHPGQTVTGKIVQITDDEVCVNIGYKSDGLIPRAELVTEGNPRDTYALGDDIEVEVVKVNDGEGNVLLSQKNIVARKSWDRLVEAYEKGEYIQAVAKNVVKGGLIAYVDNVRTFVPASHLTERYVEKIDQFIGQTLTLKIIEIDPQRRRIVASRKAALQEESKKKHEDAWSKLAVGQIVHGVVRRLTAFGAFVDIGGVDGLVHVTDLCWGRIKHPSEVVKVNDEIDVMVLNLDPERDRISLGLKQTKPKPWETAQVNYPVGSIVEGKVAHLVSFGAFVELEPGLDGLVHISQISNQRVEKAEDVLTPGQIVRVRVLDVNPEAKRISLSIRDAMEPEAEEQLLDDLPVDMDIAGDVEDLPADPDESTKE